MNRQQFLQYIDHFNNKRYDEVTSYFTPDVNVEFRDSWNDSTVPARTLYGRKGFIESYKVLHSLARETLALGDYLDCGNIVAAEIYTEFHYFKDSPASPGRIARQAGEAVIMTNWVIYNLENDKFKRIRICHFRMHDPSTARFK